MRNEEILKALISNELNAKTLTIESDMVQVIDSKILELAEDLKIAIKLTNADGISAPQIGIHKRVIAFRNLSGDIEVLVNPEIVGHKGSQLEEERCLSFPHILGKVERYKYVKVKALNLKGEEIIVEAYDRIAAILSHEIDHLDGVLFVDIVKGNIKDPYDLKRKIYDVSKNIAKREIEEGTER